MSEEYIHDPIHGEIVMSPLAIKIIDHPYFERMHYIMQTGMAYRIFPSATHSRKSHSIGTYGLTKKLLEILSKNIEIDPHSKELICIGALCHDLGHCAGSHIFDKHILPKLIESKCIDENHSWVHHEKRSIDIFKEISIDLNLSNQDIEFVCKVIEPPENEHDWKFTLVNNKFHGIDTDKLDYISRDNYMLGLKLNIDIDRIISKSQVIDNKWSFSHDIQDEIFNIYFVRYRLYKYIYNHPKIVSFDILFRDIILSENLYKEIQLIFKNKNISKLVKITDSYVLQHGNNICVERFTRRNACTLVGHNTYNSETKIENIPLHIKICKNSSDMKNNIPLHNPETTQTYQVDETFFWSMLPTDEHLNYHFVKN